MIPKPPRFASPKYLSWIREQPCVNCGAPGPSGVGHLSGAGLKAPDSHAMPLCRTCHQSVHDGYTYLGEQWEWVAKTAAKALVEIIEGRLRI